MRAAVALLLLALSAGAEEIVVRVTVGDEPLADASLQVQPMRDAGPTFRADRFAPDARTDATGQAVVQATHKDWILVYVPGYELAVVRGGGRMVDVPLRPEWVFSGRVLDTKGDPIVGASVLLRTTFRRKADFPVVTGEKGKFHVYGLWFDDYALRLEAAGFLALEAGGYPGWGEDESLTAEDSGKTIILMRVATIAGTVTDHRQEAVPGAEVRVAPAAPFLPSRTATTAADGTYRITGLEPERRYWVDFPLPWGGHAGPVVLAEGEVREGVDVVRLAPVTLKLRVVDAEGRGLEGVTGRLTPPLGRQEVTSNAKGFIVVRIPPVRLGGELRLHAKGRETSTVRVPPSRPGATQDLGEIVQRALPEIEVRVRQPDGTPPAEGKIATVPLVDGAARVKGANYYKITVPGYPPVYQLVEPPGPVVVTLPTPQWIEGNVLDTYGGPVAGAQVSASSKGWGSPGTRTDAAGRFSIGPFAEGPVEVEAHTATAKSGEVRVVLGDGQLELTLFPTKPDLVRGRVLRGIRPVPRFSIEGKHFVDEEGRFEIFVQRAARGPVAIYVDMKTFHFALPPEGQELVARLPGGRVVVTLEGAVPGQRVALGHAGGFFGSAETQEDGLARFADLAPGVYTASADGFATTEFTVGGDADTLVTLQATTQGNLLVRVPQGFRDPGVRRKTLNPGVHRDLYIGRGDYAVTLDAVRIVAGEETVVDFAPINGGSLLLRGRPETRVDLKLRLPDVTLIFDARLEADGTFRFPLLAPGAYTVRAPLRRMEVEIVAGDAAVLELGAGAHVVADRVVLWNGKPAQGAEVRLLPADAESHPVQAPTDLHGRFRFANVLPGEYTCVALLEGYAPARGAVTVGVDGIVSDGLPLTLPRSVGKHARVLGLAGEPVPYVRLRVDGHWQETDELGRLLLHAVPARIDLDLEDFASLRDLEVHAGDEIRLERGATLVVLTDPEAGPPVVRVNGRPWRRLRPGWLADDPEPGRLRLEDLPPGRVEIELPRPAEGGEEEAAETPEPVVASLAPGTETIADLRQG
ncbi:MAG: carboxypeptidase regulatory-like domain-containing protein [Planctomycetota bacterium]|jgi:protocatechuate 3,4-dioxygenase beta subunit